MTVCKKCLLTSDYPGITFDDKGVCQLCRADYRGFRAAPPPQLVENCRRDFKETVAQVSGNYPYDAVLCLSGGKDSAWLAYVLRKKYNLNLLAYNMQAGFGSRLARPNTALIAKKLGLTLKTFCWPPDFSREFYRYCLTHPLKDGLTATVCRICHAALISSAVRMARDEGIPLVLIGYSPLQTARDWFYELKKAVFLEHLRLSGNIWGELDIPADLRNRFFLPGDNDDDPFPRILMPLHILPYPSEKEVRRELDKIGLLAIYRTLTRRTTCDLRWLMTYLDTLHFGDPPFRDWVSEKIRKGEESRLKYLLAFKVITVLSRLRLLKRGRIRPALRKLGLTEKEVLEALKSAQVSEENFGDIYRINPSREVLKALMGNS